MQENYKRLEKILEKHHAIGYAQAVMSWDGLTGAPESGSDARSRSIGALSALSHQLLINDAVKSDLDYLLGNMHSLTEIEKSVIVKTKQIYEKIAKIPVDEFQDYTALTTKSQIIWEDCKRNNDFEKFKPYLQKIVDYTNKFADYRGFEGHPYNLYIDDYEEGMDVSLLNEFFHEIRKVIVPLLKKITAGKVRIKKDFLDLVYPVDAQDEISRNLLEIMGFDLSKGMLKTSEHPFTNGIDINDVRLTTHYYENDFKSAFLSTVHEGGHAIYEQNINPLLAGTLLATGASYGIHESQSRIYENNFIKSRPFINYYFPVLKEKFPQQLNEVTAEEFYRAINTAQPSLIRTEADELTYCLHIMVRYELELALMDKTIEVDDLPVKWKEKMVEYLGIEPQDDASGVLQDVHWSAGYFGYFPTYALGTAFAAQLEHYMRKEIDVDSHLASGDFSVITKWLTDKIHQYGAQFTPVEIIYKSTGEKLNAKYYCDYLERKYSEIYEL